MRRPRRSLPGPGRARGGVLHELDGEDHAALADLGDVRVIAQVFDRGEHVRRRGAIAFDHGLIAENGERGVGGGAGQRIAGVAVRMEKRVELACIRRRRRRRWRRWSAPRTAAGSRR